MARRAAAHSQCYIKITHRGLVLTQDRAQGDKLRKPAGWWLRLRHCLRSQHDPAQGCLQTSSCFLSGTGASGLCSPQSPGRILNTCPEAGD